MALQIRSASSSFVDTGHLGPVSGYFFTLNTIIGAGFLSLPWAFDQGGWLFSLCFLIASVVQSYIISIQLLDVMSKVEAITQMREKGTHVHFLHPLKVLIPASKEELLLPTEVQPWIGSRRLDISECMRALFGNKVGAVYVFVLFISMQGLQLAYASVFASSFASNVPLGPVETCDIYHESSLYNDCKWKYWTWLCVYSAFMIVLVLKGIEEQQSFQAFMSFMRFLIMITVICCCIADAAGHHRNESQGKNAADWPPLVDFTHIGQAIPIILIALVYQQNIPTIASHVRNKEKNLHQISAYAVGTCAVFYVLLGLTVPVGIPNVPSMCTLSFRNYTAGYDLSDRPWWTYAIEYVVVIFPAIDVMSSFPLIALMSADNLLTMVFGNESTKAQLYIVRLVVCLPPLFLAMFLYNLGEILDWVGLLSMLLVPAAIQFMQLGANTLVKQSSAYSTIFSHPVLLT